MRQRYPRWLRHVSQLGSTMEYVLTNWEGDEVARYEKAHAVTAKAAARFGLPTRYLGSRLHDGRVMELSISGDRLKMAVSDLELKWLGIGLNPVVGRKAWPPGMPVVYDFNECPLIKTYTTDEFGNLYPISWRRVMKSRAEFLYADVVPGERDTLLWSCILWTRPLQHVVLVVESKKPSIEEHHREVWLETYGPEWMWVYEAYDKVKDNRLRLVDFGATGFLQSIGVDL